MAIRTFSIVSALATALGVATAIAPTAFAQTYDRAPAMFSNAAAHLGDGWSNPDEQKGLPQYSPTAYVTHGSTPSYLRLTGYVGDGSTPGFLRFQQEETTEPGYSAGAGS